MLALGSWRTYERISRAQGIAVMRAAQECGITFLDDARYDDETGTAAIRTGYSEIVFGELFRSAGWKRDEVVVANKLWWEFWPEQSAAAEVDASLGRMGFDYIDVLYSWTSPQGPPIEEIVGSVGGLIESGRSAPGAPGTGIRPTMRRQRKSRELRECRRRVQPSFPTASRCEPTSSVLMRSRRSMLQARASSHRLLSTAEC